MDNKVIEVLDYMGEKLGIAIDWTVENVMPQATEFMGRYQIYAIIECALHAIMFIIGIVIMGIILKKMFNGIATEDHNNIWYDMHWNTDGDLPFAISVTFALIIVAFVFLSMDNVFEIAKWALIPEIQFFETFSEYLKSAN